jgi:formate dehydrogenase subunit delta
MSHDQTLIRMANQIAAFFKAYPHDQAVADIRSHIKSYWTPKMRYEMCERARAEPDGIDPLVLEAVKDFRRVAEGAPIPGTAAASVERGEPLSTDGRPPGAAGQGR